MDVYLAGENTKKRIMDIFLAGEHPVKNGKLADWKQLKILETFYYARKNADFERLYRNSKVKLLLDSGAFTFIQGNAKVNWDKYVEEYAAFVKKYDIQLFFELDIDSIVGLAEVERLRNKLEALSGRKPIPVWHKNRGKEYFVKMCMEYPYVALGGYVIKEIPKKQFESAFPWFINTAHKHNCKIHGLGYTCIENLKKYHFDSVDSTAWLYGNRGGYIYQFKPSLGNITQINKPTGTRLVSNAAALHNFNEWVKYQQWAEKFL